MRYCHSCTSNKSSKAKTNSVQKSPHIKVISNLFVCTSRMKWNICCWKMHKFSKIVGYFGENDGTTQITYSLQIFIFHTMIRKNWIHKYSVIHLPNCPTVHSLNVCHGSSKLPFSVCPKQYIGLLSAFTLMFMVPLGEVSYGWSISKFFVVSVMWIFIA